MSLDAYRFPADSARGWTRWWWYGCMVTERDIDRQLLEMKNAHMGGVEIQITYPLDFDGGETGRRHINFFSPEFFGILSHTVEYARSLGMQVDFTLGSGWPFGGPFISQDMAPVSLIPLSHDVKGPSVFSFDYTCALPGDIARCVLVKVSDNGALVPDTAVDITGRLSPVLLYGWPWGVRLNEIEIPDGLHRIFTFVEGRYRQQVGIPSYGMEGHAIDHCRRDVCDLYFSTLGDTLTEKLGPGAFHAFFCDSIELSGNNWTGILPEEFKKRRGYDLSPYLPALWADMGEITPRVRYDYYLTFSELTLENFFENFTTRCSAWGLKSRIQAHGIWADILRAYGAAHIPEGETFGSHDRYDVNTIHRRLAVSAGMVYGRPIVSNESFTWLRMPRFLETPEMIKRAADAIFCDGINRIINHGWSYSPEDAGRPGWTFYASSMLSMNNTWWPWYPALGAYIHRVSAMMQTGTPHSEVAVYLPQADVWSDSPMAELHMCMKLDEYIGHEMMNLLQRKGFWFTYVNDEAIEKSGLSEAGMRIGGNVYKAVILPAPRRMPAKTAKRLEAYVRGGGALLALGDYPRQSPGLVNAEENDRAVADCMGSLFAEKSGEWHSTGSGRAALSARTGAEMTDLLRQVVTPSVCSDAEEDLGYIRRDAGGKIVYFIANIARTRRTVNISLPHAGKGFAIIDALTGETVRPAAIEDKDGRLFIRLLFRENQSILVEIGREFNAKTGAGRPECAPVPVEKELTELNNWSLTIRGSRIAGDLKLPVGWHTFDSTKYYCGEGIYETAFPAPAARPLWLKIDDVFCCAEVFVNGEPAGKLWKAPWELDISAFVRPGENTLHIAAVNTWFNEFINPNRSEPVAGKAVDERWPHFSRIIDTPRTQRLYGWRERDMVKEIQPSGICGRVLLLTKHAQS